MNKPEPWTPSETAIIIKYGRKKSDEELALMLRGRSIAAIAKKRQREGIFKYADPEPVRIAGREDARPPTVITDLAFPGEGDDPTNYPPVETSVLMLFLSHAENYDIKTLEQTRETLAKLIDKKIRKAIRAGSYSKP